MASKKISQLPSGSANIPLSGQTAVVYSGVTHQQTLSSLRQILVNSGSHYFTGSQFINGNLVVTGSIIAQEYIVSSSVSHITTQTVSGSSNFGDTLDDKHNFTGSVKITGSLNIKGNSDYTGSVKITGSLNVKGNSSLTGSVLIGTGSFETDNPEILHVENSGSFNVVHLQANNQYYAQLNLKNTNNGNNASADIVVTADNGSESIHYIDMGINSSTYTGGFVGYANDAYLLNAGKDLYVGTIGGVTHPSSLKLFALNLWDNPQITISGSRQISFNTGSVSNGYVYEFSGSVKLDNSLKVNGAVTASYFKGDGSQLTNLPIQQPDLSFYATTGSNTFIGNQVIDGFIQTSQIQSSENSIVLQPDLNDGRTIEIYNTSPSDIHIKGNASYTFLGDDTTYVKLDSSDESITINTNNGVGVYGNTNIYDNLTVSNTIYGNEIQNNGQDLNIKVYYPNNLGLWSEGGTVNVTGSLYVDGAIDLNGGNIATNGGNIRGNNFRVDNILNLGATSERFVVTDGAFIPNTQPPEFDYEYCAISYVSAYDNPIDIKLINVPEESNKALGFTVILDETTNKEINSFIINNVTQNITWVGGIQPDTKPNVVNVFSFSMLRISGDWRVFGQLTTF